MNQLSIDGEKLHEKEEITLTYKGPSFNEGKMELCKLTEQLKSVEIIIEELISELYKQRKLSEREKTKVYLELKKSSFAETISIIFNHPLTIAIIGGAFGAIFNRLLQKREKPSEINVDKMYNNYGVVNNFNFIISPLQDKEDKLIIKIPNQEEEILLESDKDIISKSVNKIKNEEEKTIEVVEEEFFGNLNSVNIKQEKFGFIREGTNKIIPTSFDNEPNIKEIKNILAERLKIKARATYTKNEELKKIEIIDYEIKERKTLREYLENGNDKSSIKQS